MNDYNIEDTRQPPDEEEAQYCGSCGTEMEQKRYEDAYFCNNQFCPEKFSESKEFIVKDMAQELVETKDKLQNTIQKLKYTKAQLANVKLHYDRLTRSQSNIVVRDTEYAVKRMEDALDYHEDDCDAYAMGVFRKEWSEIKKILKQGE
jgi:NAD-dependent DNA ligase